MIRSRHALVVPAPVEVVWALMVDVEGWPSWQPEVTAASIDGAFVPGASFLWSSGGLDIVSPVQAVEPWRQLRWSGPAGAIWGEHTWAFEPQEGGVLVLTDETWAGAPVDADLAAATRLLDSSLQRWLGLLAAEAGSRSGVVTATEGRDA